MELTIYSAQDPSLPLNNYQDVTATAIRLAPGADTKTATNWVIHGKAVIGNADGDAQNATAMLVLRQGNMPNVVVLDRTDIRIDQYGNTVSVCLLAVIPSTQLSPRLEWDVELHAATYRGHIQYARLAAMSTDELVIQPSNI